MSATRFTPREGPPLEQLGLRPHHYHRGLFGRCRRCEMPKGNRVHDEAQLDGRSEEAAMWAESDAARLGERDW